MNRYTSYCTEEQVQRAYDLGAPIEIYDGGIVIIGNTVYESTHPHKKLANIDNQYAIIPTTQQMIGWLIQKGFGFCIDTSVSPSLFVVLYKQRVQVKSIHIEGYEYKDYILGLNHLINAALKFLEHQGE